MNIPNFNSEIQKFYGREGVSSLAKINQALKPHSMSIVFNEKNKNFTILDSSDKNINEINKIFKEKSFVGWEPRLTSQLDMNGNHLVELIATNNKPIITAQQEESRVTQTPLKLSNNFIQNLVEARMEFETLSKIAEALENHSIEIVHNEDTATYTLRNSSHFDRFKLQINLNLCGYETCQPKLIDEREKNGDFIMKLVKSKSATNTQPITTSRQWESCVTQTLLKLSNNFRNPQEARIESETLSKIAEALEHHSIKIVHNEETSTYTLQNSSHFDRFKLQINLNLCGHAKCQPRLIDEREKNGDFIMKLVKNKLSKL